MNSLSTNANDLNGAGVRTVKQFQEAQDRGSVSTIGRVTNFASSPSAQKHSKRASAPHVHKVEPVIPGAGEDPSQPPVLRISGRNLVRKGLFPQVKIDHKSVSILKSSPSELLISPGADQWSGELSIETTPQIASAMSFDLTSFAPSVEIPTVVDQASSPAPISKYSDPAGPVSPGPPEMEVLQ